MTDDRVPVLAASDTLLGMLQRGQGAGFVAALSLPPDDVHPHLIDCITHDPRWDHQLDTRSEYYGDLAIAVGLGVEPLEKHLRHHDEDELGGLVIPTLGRMAQWGHAGAREVLVEYVAYGEACADAVNELATWPEAWAGLDAVLCARFPKDDDLITGLGLHHRYLGEDPWSTWAVSDSRLGAILRTVLRGEEEGDRRQAEDDLIRFGQTLAVEALWDCEPQVREIGCRFADVDDARVRPRLEAILSDPLGGVFLASAVQDAARKLRLMRADSEDSSIFFSASRSCSAVTSSSRSSMFDWDRASAQPIRAMQLLALSYPADEYLQAVEDEAETPPLPRRRDSCVVVYRPGQAMRRQRLSRPQALLLASLMAGTPLYEAFAPLMTGRARVAPRLLMEWFRGWLAEGMFSLVGLTPSHK